MRQGVGWGLGPKGGGAARSNSTRTNRTEFHFYVRAWAVGHGHGTHKTKKLCTLELERERGRWSGPHPLRSSSLLSFSFPPLLHFIFHFSSPPSSISLSPSPFPSFHSITRGPCLDLARAPSGSRDLLVEWDARTRDHEVEARWLGAIGRRRKEGSGTVSREFVRPSSYRES